MKKFSKFLCLAVSCAVTAQFLAACAPDVTLEFSSGDLEAATVGVAYEADLSINTESNATVTYSLKEGSELPAGLTLGAYGALSGIPEKSADDAKFTVIATAENLSQEAEFSLDVNRGALTYEDAEVRAVINKPSNTSVAFAQNGVNVTYSLESGTLPAGLTLAEDGTLTGTPTNRRAAEVVITASAQDCEPATANIRIRITDPWLSYEDEILPIATLGQFYTANIANAAPVELAEDAEVPAITYALAAGSSMPAGLRIENGYIVGEPTSPVIRHPIRVRAQATGYDTEIAEMTITVRTADDISVNQGRISFEGRELPVGEVNAACNMLSTSTDNVIVNARATNRNFVTYTVAAGSSLPAGITLYPNGSLVGTPTASGNYTFSVTASAANCEPVTCEFTWRITNPRVPYRGRLLEGGEVNVAYTENVGTANVPAGTEVTYSLKEGSALPAGLTLAADGTISGTPTKSVKNAYFTVLATAAGEEYGGPGEATFYINIVSAVQSVANGRLEAEYIDLTGISGGGYSGGASEEGMVQRGDTYGASNGYYIGFLHSSSVRLTFRFTSTVTEATQVTLTLGLASELTGTFSPATMAIGVNGVEHNYPAISLTSGPSGSISQFGSYNAGTITIVPGDNYITIEILQNTLLQGTRTGGPMLDFIELGTSTISWRPVESNLNQFGV